MVDGQLTPEQRIRQLPPTLARALIRTLPTARRRVVSRSILRKRPTATITLDRLDRGLLGLKDVRRGERLRESIVDQIIAQALTRRKAPKVKPLKTKKDKKR